MWNRQDYRLLQANNFLRNISLDGTHNDTALRISIHNSQKKGLPDDLFPSDRPPAPSQSPPPLQGNESAAGSLASRPSQPVIFIEEVEEDEEADSVEIPTLELGEEDLEEAQGLSQSWNVPARASQDTGAKFFLKNRAFSFSPSAHKASRASAPGEAGEGSPPTLRRKESATQRWARRLRFKRGSSASGGLGQHPASFPCAAAALNSAPNSAKPDLRLLPNFKGFSLKNERVCLLSAMEVPLFVFNMVPYSKHTPQLHHSSIGKGMEAMSRTRHSSASSCSGLRPVELDGDEEVSYARLLSTTGDVSASRPSLLPPLSPGKGLRPVELDGDEEVSYARLLSTTGDVSASRPSLLPPLSPGKGLRPVELDGDEEVSYARLLSTTGNVSASRPSLLPPLSPGKGLRPVELDGDEEVSYARLLSTTGDVSASRPSLLPPLSPGKGLRPVELDGDEEVSYARLLSTTGDVSASRPSLLPPLSPGKGLRPVELDGDEEVSYARLLSTTGDVSASRPSLLPPLSPGKGLRPVELDGDEEVSYARLLSTTGDVSASRPSLLPPLSPGKGLRPVELDGDEEVSYARLLSTTGDVSASRPSLLPPLSPGKGLRPVELDGDEEVSYARLLSTTGDVSASRPSLLPPLSPAGVPPPGAFAFPAPGSLASADTPYDPHLLQDPAFGPAEHKTTLAFPGYVTTLLDYVDPAELKKQMNERFRERCPHVAVTLSKIRSIKLEMREVAAEAELDLGTLAHAFAYFEKLILKGLLNKENRKAVAAASLLVAAKLNDTKGPNLVSLIDKTESQFRLNRSAFLQYELPIAIALSFELLLPEEHVTPHYHRLLSDAAPALEA